MTVWRLNLYFEGYAILGFTVYLGFGVLLVFTIIGLLIWSSRKVDLTENNKKISIVIGLLQTVHILIFFTDLLGKIGEANVYIAFGICAIISIICFLLSVWILLPFSNFKHVIKYLFIFFAIIQVLATIFIYLLPEAGIPAPIHVWFMDYRSIVKKFFIFGNSKLLCY